MPNVAWRIALAVLVMFGIAGSAEAIAQESLDPVQQRTFSLTPQIARILALWQESATLADLRRAAAVNQIVLGDDDLGKIISQMTALSLTEATSGEEMAQRALALASARKPLMSLFIRRQHIGNPRPLALWLIQKTDLFRKGWGAAAAGLFGGATALLLTAKISQLSPVLPSFTASWFFMIAGIWVVSKTVHELGHAFAATRFGAMERDVVRAGSGAIHGRQRYLANTVQDSQGVGWRCGRRSRARACCD